ncbi:MAG: hypothetical protein WKF57_05930 [Nakamurella sp.]
MSDYPLWLGIRPLTTWPGELTPSGKRRQSQFSAPMGSTTTLLRQELAALNAKQWITEVAIPSEDFRLDGGLRVRAKATHPGVVLSLPKTNVGPLRYATDVFTTWADNLRAIALGMESLRRVDRYGIARRGEQYAGFRALPPGGIAMPAGPMTETEALAFLSVHSGIEMGPSANETRIVIAYRSAAKKLHPDAGGSTELFQRLGEAMRTLKVSTR